LLPRSDVEQQACRSNQKTAFDNAQQLRKHPAQGENPLSNFRRAFPHSMNGSLLLWLLVGIIVAGMAQLAWRGGRWFLTYLAQLACVAALAAVAAIFYERHPEISIAAWTLFFVVVILPAILSAQANRLLLTGHAGRAARRWKWMSWLVWGNLGARYNSYAELFADVYTAPIETLEDRFNRLQVQSQPAAVRGTLLSFRFLVYSLRGEWQRAVNFFESVGKWAGEGSIGPRLQVARAYAELGNLPEALGQLHHVQAEPQSFRYRDAIFLAQAPIFALAGDVDRLRALFKEHRDVTRRLPKQYLPYWMGRCRMARGEREQAALDFHEALSLVPPHHTRWRDAIQKKLETLESTPRLAQSPFAATESYARAIAQLEQTRENNREIRSLLALTQPALATGLLVLAMIAAHLVVLFVLQRQSERELSDWFKLYGNVPVESREHGQWWRIGSAIFLHANWMHLLLNAATMLAFGSAIERLWGRTRALAIFFAAALTGNALSVFLSRSETMASVGASGGAFGLLAAYWLALIWVRLPKYRKFKRRLVLLLSAVIALDICVGLLTELNTVAEFIGARIDNWAHIGGFAAGLALAFFIKPRAQQRQSAPQPSNAATSV
jgi:membrane associated rhomboid family serine protease